MDIRDYLRVLRARWRLITACVLVALIAAGAATALATKVYEAKSQLFVSTQGVDGVTGLQQGGQFAQQRVKSYAEVINSPLVTGPVVTDLGLQESPADLGENVTATAPLDTVLIDVTVKDTSPQQAQRIANAVAEQFTKVASELEAPTGGGTSAVRVSVVRQADLPTGPVSPRPKLNLALGLLVGLAIGVGAAVLRETLDTSVKGPDELQEQLGLSTLGLITFDSEAARRPLIVQADPHSGRAEAFRQLRTNLQFLAVDDPPRSIVVTSSLPQEGKSTTACNLAITLAQAGVRVAVVDSDLRRPRLAAYLGLEGAVGLTDVLVGRADLDDVLQPWGDGQLLVLPSGPTPPNPSELLGSRQMQELLEHLEQRVDLVLLDAPPLLPVTDAAVLSTLASGAVVVVHSGRTKREQVQRAVELLRSVDAQVYGLVLNMVPAKSITGYGYGYGARYGLDGAAPVTAAPRVGSKQVS